MGTTPPSGAISVSAGSSIQTAVNAASTGATFWLGAGVHRMQHVTPKDGQTFIGADGAIMNGSQLITSFTQENGKWVIGGQTQQGDRNGTGFPDEGAERAGYPETLFFDDVPLKPVDTLAEVTTGKFYFDYAADKIYIADNPSGHKVEAGKSEHAFNSTANGVTIENLIIEKYNAPAQYGAIHADGSDWTVKDSEVRWNYGIGIYTKDDGQVINNHVHDNGQLGLGGNGDFMLIEGNEIEHNGYWSGIDPGWEAGGTKWAETDGLIVRGNHSHDNYGYGLWTDIDNINTLYENNLVENNLDGGIVHEISYAATIRDNVLIGNGTNPDLNWLWGSAILLQNSQDVDVYDNQIDMTGGGGGISMVQQNRGTGAYGAWVTTDNDIHDNVTVGMTVDDGFAGGVADYNQSAMLTTGGNTLDYNDYRVTNLADDHWAWGSFYGWTAYKAASGQESHSTASTSPLTITASSQPGWAYTPGAWADTPAHSNSITGTNSNQTINGTSANDRIDPLLGEDLMYGGAGSDTYIVNSDGDRATEQSGQGTDLALVRNGVFQMDDHLENAKVDYAGSATIHGSNQDNTITGGAFADSIFGDSGKDRMTGGGGYDTFVLNPGDVSGDMILDFAGNGTLSGDKISIEGFGAGTTLTNFGDIWKITNSSGSETLRILGVSTLASDDVVFV